MSFNYADPGLIKKLAQEINGPENTARRSISLKQYEVLMDRMEPYVKQYLRTFYNEADVNELPLITSINLARRIVKQEASVYKNPPVRTFTGVSEEQILVLEEVYRDMNIDAVMQKSNEYFKLQSQNNIQIIPYKGELKIRVLMNHNFDVVPDQMSSDIADAYVLSGFNKMMTIPSVDRTTDGNNETIADADDYQSSLKMHVLWSKDFNFLFDENGNIRGGTNPNPIGIIPFVDISPAKDFEFFIQQGSSITDFTIQFNASLTDMSQIVRMQGFAQAYMIAEESAMPTSIKVGPMIAIKMPVNADSQVRPEFGFAQPNADIQGSGKYLESLLALFLSSRGLDPKSISTTGDGTRFTSGMERLLSMIEKFEATLSDFNVFKNAESSIFQIVKAYLNTYSGPDVLKYKIATISDDAGVDIAFEKPEMIQTELDQIVEIEKKLDLGLMSKLGAIMDLHGLSREDAQKILDDINNDNIIDAPKIAFPDLTSQTKIKL